MDHVIPEHATDAGKVLNSYYEDVYKHLPSILWPAGMLLTGQPFCFCCVGMPIHAPYRMTPQPRPVTTRNFPESRQR